MPAGLLLCLVIAISDGDSLTARCPSETGHHNVKVRLAGIDAPEAGQPHSRRSRQALARLCHRQTAEIRTTATDHYGRSVAQVRCRGIDANASQVHSGMAWVATRHAPPAHYKALEQDARTARRGLWADARPVAPWAWRARHARG
mgnify:CR=1 FL=1